MLSFQSAVNVYENNVSAKSLEIRAELYGLYNVATIGPKPTKGRPWDPWDENGKKLWDAWEMLGDGGDKTKEAAKKEFIELVQVEFQSEVWCELRNEKKLILSDWSCRGGVLGFAAACRYVPSLKYHLCGVSLLIAVASSCIGLKKFHDLRLEETVKAKEAVRTRRYKEKLRLKVKEDANRRESQERIDNIKDSIKGGIILGGALAVAAMAMEMENTNDTKKVKYLKDYETLKKPTRDVRKVRNKVAHKDHLPTHEERQKLASELQR